MYNESQKMAFVNSRNQPTTKKFVTSIFNWFEPYENEWGMDLALQSAEVLQPVVNELSGLRSKSTELLLIMLKEYVKWLKNNGYQYGRGIYGVQIDSIEKVRSQMISSPAHLVEVMKKVDTGLKKKDGSSIFKGFDPAESETVDVIYRVFLWMAFSGLYDTEAIQVKDTDIDLDRLVINFNGQKYKIYQEAKLDFEKACRLTDFNYIHPHYETRRKRVDGNLIMRSMRSEEIDLMTIRPIVNKKLNPKTEGDKSRLKVKLSYNKIYLSGAFYRMFEQERMGRPVDFSTLVAKDMKNTDYTTSATRTLNTIANKLEREYMADYDKWKCAFDV